MAALRGAALGATAGGVVVGLIGLCVPEIKAKRYEGEAEERQLSDLRPCGHERTKDRVKKIFKDNKAEDITTASESAAPAHA